MIKLLIHYLKLPSRTRSTLRSCARIIDNLENQGADARNNVDELIKKKEIGIAVDYLVNKGESLNVEDPLFWFVLNGIARDHKMRDKEMMLREKVTNAL